MQCETNLDVVDRVMDWCPSSQSNIEKLYGRQVLSELSKIANWQSKVSDPCGDWVLIGISCPMGVWTLPARSDLDAQKTALG